MWISVEDRLPKNGEHVLVRGVVYSLPISGDTPVHYEGYLMQDGATWCDWSGESDPGVDITHWMPLSALPKPPNQ